ncbi:MAG: hypothetical protein ACRCZ0_12030 [Cetobacterium sp.]
MLFKCISNVGVSDKITLDVNYEVLYENDGDYLVIADDEVPQYMDSKNFRLASRELFTKDNLYKLLSTKTREVNLLMVIEELAELQIALTRFERGRGSKSDIIEEMADCMIVIGMLKSLYDVDDEELREEAERKMKRNLKRIE